MTKCDECVHCEVCPVPHLKDTSVCKQFKDRTKYAEVVHGRFEFACVHNGTKHYKCTNCHHAFPFANVNYCPNCGAKMVEVQCVVEEE